MPGFDYPLLFNSIPVPKVWAGGKLSHLRERRDEALPEHTGESWEMSTWPGAPDNPALSTVTTVENGILAGMPLDRIASIPVVAKVIDSGQPLSVQVHPRRADEHKNEMWYLLDVAPDAYLYMGLAEGMSPEEFCRLLREEPQDEGKILAALCRYDRLEAGRHFSVPAPTVHALGSGLLTYEISERSQITYRLFDYNRERSRGKLEIDEGCHALLAPEPPQPSLQAAFDFGDAEVERLAAFSTFLAYRVTGKRITVRNATHQHLVVASRGNCRMDGPGADWQFTLPHTRTCLVPPTDLEYSIDTHHSGEVLICPLAG